MGLPHIYLYYVLSTVISKRSSAYVSCALKVLIKHGKELHLQIYMVIWLHRNFVTYITIGNAAITLFLQKVVFV